MVGRLNRGAGSAAVDGQSPPPPDGGPAAGREPGTYRIREGSPLPGVHPKAAFVAWTDPTWVRRWWAPKAFLDPVVDGSYCLEWPAQGFRLQGRFLAVEAGRLLRFTWRWTHAPFMPIRTVAVHFLADGEAVDGSAGPIMPPRRTDALSNQSAAGPRNARGAPGSPGWLAAAPMAGSRLPGGCRVIVDHGFFHNNHRDRAEIGEIRQGWRFLLRRLREVLVPAPQVVR